MTALIITGFHRSGTSMTAEYLKNAGLYLGDDLMNPHISNVHGHFENNGIVELHDRILADSGSSWMYHGETELVVKESHVAVFDKIAKQNFSVVPQWGFKDPRACLFLGHWMEALSDCRVLMVYRHYACCLQSLFKRHSRELCYWQPRNSESHLSFWQDLNLGLKMWLAYNKKLLKFYQKYPEKCLVVSQQAIVNGFDLSQLVNERFGFSLTSGTESTVDPHLTSDAAIDTGWVDDELKQELGEVWGALNAISSAKAGSPVHTPVGNTDVKSLQLDIKKWVQTIAGPCDARPDQRNDIPDLAAVAINIKSLDEGQCFQKALHELEKRHSPEVALDYINRALEMNFLKPEYHILQGRILMQLGRLNEAEASFCRAISQNPKIPFYYMHLALAYHRMECFVEARHFIDVAKNGNPNNPTFFLHSANFFKIQDNLAEAEKEFRKALSIKSDFWPAHRGLADILERKGNIEGAIEILARIARINPQSNLSQKLSNLYLQVGEVEISRKLYFECVKSGLDFAKFQLFIDECLDLIDSGDAKRLFLEEIMDHLRVLNANVSKDENVHPK